MSPELDLLSDDPEVRMEAARRVEASGPGRFALRNALLEDADANVRAAAAEALGRAADPALGRYLCDAMVDPSPLVRREVLRALKRRGDREAIPLAQRALADEPVWWVRRVAASTLGSLAEAAAIAPLLRALDDPFWRVRDTALKALFVLGDGDAGVRQAIVAAGSPGGLVVRSGLAYLGARWARSDAMPDASDAHVPPSSPLDNDDPAVTTARLLATPAASLRALDLVPLLASPHHALRAIVARRLVEAADREALKALLHFIEEPRAHDAAEAARVVLRKSPAVALELAREALADGADANVLAWAIAFVVEAGVTTERDWILGARTHPDERVRRAVVQALVSLGEDVSALVLDPDEQVRLTVASALAATSDGRAALLQLPFAHQAPPLRILLVLAAAEEGDTHKLTQALTDPHASVRGGALRALDGLGELPEAIREEALKDADPWIRGAALSMKHVAAALQSDLDPALQRQAARLVLSHRHQLTAVERSSLADLAARAPDAEVRCAAAQLLVASEATLPLLLALSRDNDPGVRAAAASRIEEVRDLPQAVERVLATGLSPEVRAAAYTLLLRDLDDTAFARLREGLASASEPESVKAHLRDMALAFSDEQLALAPALRARLDARSEPRPKPPKVPFAPPVERRALGQTGLKVAPLGVSGRNELSPAALFQAREAGANLFFWEPDYQQLTRFVRSSKAYRDDLVLATGTYHADAPSIERDVHTALRRLRTDRLDVFLLFWVRSTERLSDEAWTCLDRLKRAGLIRAAGFSTHHRELAEEALQARPWDVLMLRHSAAHPGAESRLLGAAAKAKAGVLTFSNLCYGRLLQRFPDEKETVTAADCYRYSIAQPGVSACISAPRRRRELAENLEVLGAPPLSAERIESLRVHGRRVHAESRRFDAWVRRARPDAGTAPDLDSLITDATDESRW